MFHPSRTSTKLLTAMVLAAAAVSPLASCGKKKPPPVVDNTPPPPPPPVRIDVDPLIAELHPNAKVQFPGAKATYSDSLARAVILLADAMARSDAEKFGEMLQPTAKPLLSQLEADGGWEDGTKKLEAIRVVHTEEVPPGPDAAAATVYLSLQDPDGAYVLGWAAMKVGDKWLFAGAPATAELKRRASEWDDAGLAGLMSQAGGVTPDISVPGIEPPPAAPAGEPDKPAEPSGDTGSPPSNPRRPTVPTAPPGEPGGG